jgi:hypothetical protein
MRVGKAASKAERSGRGQGGRRQAHRGTADMINEDEKVDQYPSDWNSMVIPGSKKEGRNGKLNVKRSNFHQEKDAC